MLLFSPGGDPAAGIVLTGLFSTTLPAPANSGDLWRWVMPDGAVLKYNGCRSPAMVYKHYGRWINEDGLNINALIEAALKLNN